MKELKWTSENSGKKLNDFLRTKLPVELGNAEISNSKIRRLIVAGAVMINGRQCRIPAFELKRGDTVFVKFDETKFFYEKKPEDIEYVLTQDDVLFEDESLIVVNKPAFIPTEGTIVKDRFSMHQAVVDYLWKKNPTLRNPPYVGIMHRLDRETSGVLLFTKTRTVNAAVHDMFENRSVKKIYRAVCSCKTPGAVKEKFTVENSIGRITPKSAKCKIGALPESKGGQHSKTDFVVAEKKGNLVYVDCHLHTGRTHQIRVHLSLSGLPIIGDELYGGKKGFDQNNGRIMLHAFVLEFPHPVSGEKITVKAPMDVLFGEGEGK